MRYSKKMFEAEFRNTNKDNLKIIAKLSNLAKKKTFWLCN